MRIPSGVSEGVGAATVATIAIASDPRLFLGGGYRDDEPRLNARLGLSPLGEEVASPIGSKSDTCSLRIFLSNE